MINLLSFYGRVNRSQYWVRILLLIVVMFVLGGLFSVVSVQAGPYLTEDTQLFLQFFCLLLLLVVPYAMIANLVKRLHDYGTTGWWSLLVLVPLVDVIFLIGVGVVEGEAGSNAFGPEPA
jgi:uncharacterized membrane protein YhaH (DUF805 family)